MDILAESAVRITVLALGVALVLRALRSARRGWPTARGPPSSSSCFCCRRSWRGGRSSPCRSCPLTRAAASCRADRRRSAQLAPRVNGAGDDRGGRDRSGASHVDGRRRGGVRRRAWGLSFAPGAWDFDALARSAAARFTAQGTADASGVRHADHRGHHRSRGHPAGGLGELGRGGTGGGARARRGARAPARSARRRRRAPQPRDLLVPSAGLVAAAKDLPAVRTGLRCGGDFARPRPRRLLRRACCGSPDVSPTPAAASRRSPPRCPGQGCRSGSECSRVRRRRIRRAHDWPGAAAGVCRPARRLCRGDADGRGRSKAPGPPRASGVAVHTSDHFEIFHDGLRGRPGRRGRRRGRSSLRRH